ncbi:phosphocholine-specific phospholipase C [Nocardia stercoris]|uniref:phosphocholine-specific phospholipase C n=1 Tax=Nocardia stercoris TaxID=2483361 RepID=UPI0018F6BCB7|nr:phospholipase C, phosphocholine-specific [Nocardia stercoris]
MLPSVDRRTFLAGSAAALGGAVLGSVSAGISAPTARAATGTIADVQHIVVLMQENRSFDHYYGMMKGVRGFGDRATIMLPGGKSVFDQPNGSGRQYPFALDATGSTGETMAQCQGDLPHAWADQHKAWNNGRLDSWMAAKNKIGTLGYLQRSDLPFYYALADAYTICDGYHCSGLTATGPNRTYLFSGTVHAAGGQGGPAYDGGSESGLSWQTYAEALQNAGITWKVYQNAADNYGDNGLAYFSQFTGAAHTSPLWINGMSSVPTGTGATSTDIVAGIKSDVLAGKLPQVSWIVTDQITSEHPIGPPVNGERFVSELLGALNADPNVLNSTALFITYDENDGFFDHVPPPSPAAGVADEFVNGVPVGLGFRVPMLVVSPWSKGGWVDSQVFDHTSVIRFMETWSKAIGRSAPCPNLSAWRRSVCGDLTSAFDFTKPVTGLPSLPTPGAAISAATCSVLANPIPTTNAQPTPESGTRPARALPYQPTAYESAWSWQGNNGQATLTLANSDSAAAHFAVYDNTTTAVPGQYTVAGGTRTSATVAVSSNAYDLTAVGPNRFLVRLIGNGTGAGKQLQAHTRIAVESGTGKLAFWIDMVNGTSAQVTFTVKSNNYRTDGPWTYTAKAGQTVSDFWNAVAYNNGWYDFTLTCSADSSWSRRFTGHIETGAASISG